MGRRSSLDSTPGDFLRIARAAGRGRRGRAGKGGGCGGIAILLLVGFGWFASQLQKCGCGPDPADQARREEAERARKRAEVEAKAAEEGRRNDEILRAQRTAASAAASAEAAEFRSKLQRLWAMTPAERERAMRDACSTEPGCSEEERKLISDAGSDEAERKKLAALGRALWAPYERAAAVAKTKLDAARAREERKGRVEQFRNVVCCCDGSVSPTCTTVHRGCCSHHGGVCACR